MNTSELLEAFEFGSENPNLKNQVGRDIISSIITALENEDTIYLRGFGTLSVNRYNRTYAKNPLTGKLIENPKPTTKVKFKPGAVLKESINNG